MWINKAERETTKHEAALPDARGARRRRALHEHEVERLAAGLGRLQTRLGVGPDLSRLAGRNPPNGAAGDVSRQDECSAAARERADRGGSWRSRQERRHRVAGEAARAREVRRRTRGCGTTSSFRDDDIVICTWSKSGTTWTQQIVGQLLFGGKPELYDGPDASPWPDFRLRRRTRSNARARRPTGASSRLTCRSMRSPTRRRRSTSTSGATGATSSGAGTTTASSFKPEVLNADQQPLSGRSPPIDYPNPDIRRRRSSSGSIATPIRTGRSGRTSRAGSTRGTCPTSSSSTSPISRPTLEGEIAEARGLSRDRGRAGSWPDNPRALQLRLHDGAWPSPNQEQAPFSSRTAARPSSTRAPTGAGATCSPRTTSPATKRRRRRT